MPGRPFYSVIEIDSNGIGYNVCHRYAVVRDAAEAFVGEVSDSFGGIPCFSVLREYAACAKVFPLSVGKLCFLDRPPCLAAAVDAAGAGNGYVVLVEGAYRRYALISLISDYIPFEKRVIVDIIGEIQHAAFFEV